MLKSKHIANAVLIQEWPTAVCLLLIIVIVIPVVTAATMIRLGLYLSAVVVVVDAAADAIAVPLVAAIEASLVLGFRVTTGGNYVFCLRGSVRALCCCCCCTAIPCRCGLLWRRWALRFRRWR